MARGGIPASPLPPRQGVDAQRYRMPQGGPWRTLRDHLVERLAAGLSAEAPIADWSLTLRGGDPDR